VNESVGLTECEWAHSTMVVRCCMANHWVVKTSHPCHLTDLMQAHFCYSLMCNPPSKDFRMWGHQGESNRRNKSSSFGCTGWLFLDVFKRYNKAANGILHFPNDIHVSTAFSSMTVTKPTEANIIMCSSIMPNSTHMANKGREKGQKFTYVLKWSTFTAPTFMKLTTKWFL
jgi:hypothetical protein